MWTLIHFHCGNDSLMGSLVERMLWRNVKRKQGYLNPFHISNFSLATELFRTSSMFFILLVGKSILGLADSHPQLTVILLEPFFLWWFFVIVPFAELYRLVLFLMQTLKVIDTRGMFYFVMIWNFLIVLYLIIKVRSLNLFLHSVQL